MRTYGQYCSVAKALDVVGDRWTLLIVRELFVQGACRYTDLQRGLPGIATNLLSDRLHELEEAGLVSRQSAPAPVASTLFSLTDDGRALEPVLRALGSWGARFMVSPTGDEVFRRHWFSFPVSLFLADSNPGGSPIAIELRVAEGPVAIEAAGGVITTRLGPCESPDLVITAEPPMILAVLSGYLSLQDARHQGLRTTGDTKVLTRLLRSNHGGAEPAPMTPLASSAR